MAYVLMPKTDCDRKLDLPLLFLKGPIRSAPAWHDIAIDIMKEEDVVIINPSRTIAERHKRLVIGVPGEYERQRAWECTYLELAAKYAPRGVVMAWYPGEETHSCEKSYGAMSRVEFGELLIWRKFDPSLRFIMGTDGRFPEIDTMLYDVKRYAPDLLPPKRTLEETCAAALRIALNK